jgi:hypothetical protein
MTRKRVSGPVLSDEERVIKEGDIRFVQVERCALLALSPVVAW